MKRTLSYFLLPIGFLALQPTYGAVEIEINEASCKKLTLLSKEAAEKISARFEVDYDSIYVVGSLWKDGKICYAKVNTSKGIRYCSAGKMFAPLVQYDNGSIGLHYPLHPGCWKNPL